MKQRVTAASDRALKLDFVDGRGFVERTRVSTHVGLRRGSGVECEPVWSRREDRWRHVHESIDPDVRIVSDGQRSNDDAMYSMMSASRSRSRSHRFERGSRTLGRTRVRGARACVRLRELLEPSRWER